jgi:osmoprotectant transport system ATP-binding protein
MIKVENISKSYNGVAALAPLSLAFKPQSTSVLIGPSGCGKSTLLRIMVGLVQPDAGKVAIDGTLLDEHNVEQLRHKVGYVIQEGGLFPHLTAQRNVTLLASHLGKPQDWIAQRLAKLTELTQLTPELLAHYPKDLSGGQRQRVALMRALMLDPDILLLDEPLGALDPVTRHELQTQLKAIFAALNKTVVLVTHDMNEAAYFGDEIVLLRAGTIVQRGTVDDLLRRPAEPFVSDFIRAQRSVLPA